VRKKTNPIFLGIVLCFALGTILFTLQSCSRDRSSADRSDSLGVAVDDHQPSFSPDGTRIVFFSDRDNSSEIYIMNADGSNQTRLTNNPDREVAPSWSPDSSRIVFSSNRDGNWDVYTMNVDGSDQTRLTDNQANDGMPSWSPDGSRIIFHSNRDGNWEIYTMNIDGSDQIRLTNEPANEMRPSWSPDGARIAFDSDRNGTREIYVMNADGSAQTRLTNVPINFHASWSPDGRKIAFESVRDYICEVYIMDSDGSNQVNLTNNAPVDATFGRAPLPRSEIEIGEIPYRIVYESFRETEGKENWEICLIDADGSNFVNLTKTPDIDEMYPHASPDGRRVCFEAVEGEDKESKSRNVYILNIDGTDRMKIAENANQPCWSGDGKYIAYLPGEYPRYDPTIYSNKGLEVYDLNSGEKKQHPNEQIYHIWCLCWSPDGEWFVSAHGRDMLGRENAFKAGDKTMMCLSMEGCTPDISPNGKRISWNGTDWNINIGKLDFNSPRSSVTGHKIVVACDLEHWIYHSDWSPDGKYLIFTYGKDGGNMPGSPAPGSNICICDLRTGKWTQVTTDGKHNKEPDWVPVQVR